MYLTHRLERQYLLMRKLLLIAITVLSIGAVRAPNHVTNSGVLLAGFENSSDWTLTGTGASKGDSTIIVAEGDKSLYITTSAANNAVVTKTISADLASMVNMTVYIHTDNYQETNSVTMRLSSTTDFSKYMEFKAEAKSKGGSKRLVHLNWADSWAKILVNQDDFTAVGGELWSNTMLRLQFIVDPQNTTSITVRLDDLRYNIEAPAVFLYTFDDGFVSDRKIALPILSANNQKATDFINCGKVGSVGRSTKKDLLYLRDMGWSIGNHTQNHVKLTLQTLAQKEKAVDTCHKWLVDNGFTHSAVFFSYPYGSYDAETAGVVADEHVMARATGEHINAHMVDNGKGNKEHMMIHSYVTENTDTPQKIKDLIDETILKKGVLTWYIHEIIRAPALPTQWQWTDLDLKNVSDYLKTKQDAGEIEVMTFEEYWNTDVNISLKNDNISKN